MTPSSPLALTRRRLLGGGAALLGGLAAFRPTARLLPVARAQEALEDRYFIFCYFSGGWDLLMSLDPRDPALFREDLKKQTRIQPGFEYLEPAYQDLVSTSVDAMTFGPAIGGLARHADRLAVVRGMSMDTLTHEVGRRRFLTGHPPAGLQASGSSLATVLASYLGAEQPMPQLSVLVESYNAEQPSYATAIRVTSVDDLVRALSPSPDALSGASQEGLDALIAQLRDCPSAQSTFHQRADEFRLAAQQLVAQGLHERFAFDAETEEMEALRDLYGIDPYALDSAAAQCASAITAITSGISRCVSIVAADDLDSHGPEWSSSHAPRLEEGFNLVAAMIDDLESREYGTTGESWLDRTTIVGFSEFGRSPLLNSSGGRDHYLHNACFLAGGGIRGGQVIGASSDVGMAPTPTDLQTGAPIDEGETVLPEHVFRALLHDVGITEDVVDYGVEPLMALYG